MQAVILAGGKGRRLHPYTTILPKPLMPVGDLPILEIVLRQLSQNGFDSIILAVGSQVPLFRALFEDGSKFGLSISYSVEDKPLGTAGPLAMLADQLEEHFLVMNGDLLTTLSYRSLYDFHLRQDPFSAITIAGYEREAPIDFGVLETRNGHSLDDYVEKPIYKFLVSMGIYAMSREAVLPHIAVGGHFDFPDLVKALLRAHQGVGIYREDCYWLDIGRVEDCQTANAVFESRRDEFLRLP